MSYSSSIPNAGDFLAISQKQMLANYMGIYNAFLQDHVSLTSNNNSGMHNALTLRPQSGDPTTASGQSAIYNKLVSSDPQLFFRPDTNQTPIQLTNSNLNTAQTGAPGNTQSSFVAGPFTVYFGFIASCAVNQVVTLLPSTTLLYVGLSTFLAPTNSPGLASTAAAVNINSNQFTVSYNNAAGQITVPPTIYYLAIGQ